MPGYRSTLVEMQADGTALTNSTSESTTFLSPQAKWTLPAGYLNRVGKRLLVTASGRISNVVTTPGTLILRLKFGAINVATSQAIALNIVAKTNVTWYLELDLLLRSIGSSTSATFFPSGLFTSESVVGAATGQQVSAGWQVSAPVVGTGFDSIVANQIDLSAQFSVSTATTSIQCHTFQVEDLTTTP